MPFIPIIRLHFVRSYCHCGSLKGGGSGVAGFLIENHDFKGLTRYIICNTELSIYPAELVRAQVKILSVSGWA